MVNYNIIKNMQDIIDELRIARDHLDIKSRENPLYKLYDDYITKVNVLMVTYYHHYSTIPEEFQKIWQIPQLTFIHEKAKNILAMGYGNIYIARHNPKPSLTLPQTNGNEPETYEDIYGTLIHELGKKLTQGLENQQLREAVIINDCYKIIKKYYMQAIEITSHDKEKLDQLSVKDKMIGTLITKFQNAHFFFLLNNKPQSINSPYQSSYLSITGQLSKSTPIPAMTSDPLLPGNHQKNASEGDALALAMEKSAKDNDEEEADFQRAIALSLQESSNTNQDGDFSSSQASANTKAISSPLPHSPSLSNLAHCASTYTEGDPDETSDENKELITKPSI